MKAILILVGFLLAALMAITTGAPDLVTQAELRSQAATGSKAVMELTTTSAQLDASIREVANLRTTLVERDAQIAQWQAKYAALDQVVLEMNGTVVGLQNDLAATREQLAVAQTQQIGIPVTGEQCLVSAADIKEVGWTMWAAIAGVVALGGGGWVAHLNSANRKYTVRMTRSQYEAYARYVQAGGNRAR